MKKQAQPSWRQPLKRIRSNCSGCQKRHAKMQQGKQALVQALNRKFGR